MTMTDAKHTPGPWRVLNGYVFAGDVFVACCESSIDRPHVDEEANCRLIAAAPTLYDTLITITQLKNDPSLTDTERAEMARNMAFAALAAVDPPPAISVIGR